MWRRRKSRNHTFVLTFEVDSDLKTRFDQALDVMGTCIRLNATSALINTSKPASEIMHVLHQLTGPKDSVWLFTASAPWTACADLVIEDEVLALLGPDEGNWIYKYPDEREK